MFTGLVEEVGVVERLSRGSEGFRLSVRARLLGDAKAGESVCVSGACLTVIAAAHDSATFDLSPETIEKTTLASLRHGDSVNLERALRVGDRMGGHFVQGHVDGVGEIVRIAPGADGGVELAVRAPDAAVPFLAPKGSVAVDGISLTVADLRGDLFTVAIIPYTLSKTTVRDARPGRCVNIEADILAKYAARTVSPPVERAITEDLLRSYGY